MADVCDTLQQVKAFLKTAKPNPLPERKKILMADPEYFDVEYIINPHMADASGKPKKVDKRVARVQWQMVREAYERLGYEVPVMKAQPGLPDFVFSANHGFPFWDHAQKRPHILLSIMESDHRKPEIIHFQKWCEDEGYTVESLQTQGVTFEGNGDSFLHPNGAFVWGATGTRSKPAVYDEFANRFHWPVIRLQLQLPELYHLDTCFQLLNEDTVAFQPKAFTEENGKMIREVFSNVIELDIDENLKNFAGNCHCPDGKHVLLHRGSKKFNAALEKLNFNVIELDTTEYMKSGGSVFCMKLQMF